jgi:pyruvate dehydrogenase E1 component
MIALVGDAELDEGNIFEALQEGWKQDVRNLWWIIDYNRQSLDAVSHEGLYGQIENLFRAFGWEVVTLKYGHLLQAAFTEPGGAALREWIDRCPNQLYSALTFQGGAAWRERLTADLGEEVKSLLAARDDAELGALMTNLGGHDLPTVIDAFHAIDHDRPVCFIAYTIKGLGLPIAGHKDNHAGLMSIEQMASFKAANKVRDGHEWDRFEGLDVDTGALDAFLKAVPFAQRSTRRLRTSSIAVPPTVDFAAAKVMSTQDGFGRILNELGRRDDDFAARVVTTSPDVTVSTNLGPWVNRRGIFGREVIADTFRDLKIPSAQRWGVGPGGQHLELGIAEMNLFILLGALGLSHSLFGARLFPIGTLYDPFIQRGLDALNYACYQNARFILVATPSGITLAPEGGAHQSIGTPLIGLAQDGLATFEPAFVDELAAILAWSLDYLQRQGDADPTAERNWLRDETGGSVYLRLTTRPVEQIARDMTPKLRRQIIDGAYWLREPGPNAAAVIAFSGAVAPEAMMAAGLVAEDRRDVGLLCITSADRLNAGWQAAGRARERGDHNAECHIEKLLAPLSRDCGIVTVLDGHPATLAWIGGVFGHKVKALGVEHFGQSGSIADLYRHHGIDANAIVSAVDAISAGRPIRHLRALPS